jgi:hypothetical protein
VWIKIDLSPPLKCYDIGKQFMSFRPSFVTYAAIALVLAGLLAGGLYLNSQSVVAQTALPDNAVLNGYAWSSNIGWIKLASGPGDSSSFGVSIKDGVLDGYGWSPHVGWLQFDSSLLGPSGAGVSGGARFVSNALVGWARFCTALGSGCGGVWSSNPQNGGWDGWLLLGGGSLPGGGVKLAADNKLSGYAWGGENLGWVDFSKVFIGEGFIANCSVSPTQISVGEQATWRAWVGNDVNYQDPNDYEVSWIFSSGGDAMPGEYDYGDEITNTYNTEGTYTGRATITDGATSKTATCQANLTVGEGGDNELEVIVEGDGVVTTVDAHNETSSCGDGDSCYSFHDDGDVVTLTATPGTDISFVGWEGDCSGTSPTCTLTMNADKSVTATFEESQKFDLFIEYGPRQRDIWVNYQIHNLEDPEGHNSTEATVRAELRSGVEWEGTITLEMPIVNLQDKTPNGSDRPSVIVGTITLSPDQPESLTKLKIHFPTDGQPISGLVSPYAGNYRFYVTATASGSADVEKPLDFSYIDLRESEN